MWVPPACTLPSAEQPTRVAEFDSLFRAGLRTIDRPSPDRLALVFQPLPGLAETVRDLTRRESECCSFFTFTVVEHQDRLMLEVEVPTDHADILDAIFERAAANRPNA